MRSVVSHPVDKKIIELIARNRHLYMGNIVKELSIDALNVTNRIIELKHQGIIQNMSDSAELVINADYKTEVDNLLSKSS